MRFQPIVKVILGTFFALFLFSCDKEFDQLGSGVFGNNPENYLFDKLDSEVAVYNYATGAVQSNNLGLNALGIYNNPTFGTTKASFVTQLELARANPTFNNPSTITIDTVYVYVPYFTKLDPTNTDTANPKFLVDSLRGPNTGSFRLKISENGYFLRNFDASGQLQTAQRYYSDQINDFDAAATSTGSPLITVEQFRFTPEEHELKYFKNGEEKVKSKLAPGIFLQLNKEFIKQKIFNAPSGSLLNNNSFKNYFRGLHFKAESNANSEAMLASLNFASGYIQVVYHQDKLPIPTTGDLTERKELRLNLAGNTVNLFENDFNPIYAAALTNANPVTGDSQLFLKGQTGSIGIIKLFPNVDGSDAISAELASLRSRNLLINEANLIFYVDQTAQGTSPDPNRIYLYNIDDNKPIIDYFENSTALNPKFNKLIFGGIAEKENAADTKVFRYKIRITSHLNNIINKDSANVRLGLAVTELITNTTTSKLKNPTNSKFDRIPVSSVINPLGTVLYGSKIPANSPNYPKRVKLEIFYTEPK